MREELVGLMPSEAFARGLGKLIQRAPARNVVILGFDTEYDPRTQEIYCYQLSDGEEGLAGRSPYDVQLDEFKRSEILERSTDLTWPELGDWVVACLKKWGYKVRDIDTVLLVSHFSTAELSHIDKFWEASEVRRVSAAQVYNASYNINQSLRLVVMDNYHFWNVGNNGNASLMAVASKFGEHKIELPDDIDIRRITRETLKDPRFRRYGLWDAVLCARVFKKFRKKLLDDYGVDVVQYCTSASLAMAVYRQHFLPDSMTAPEPHVRRQAWLSLWGGRAEAYRTGDIYGKYTLRDVVSLYPTSERILRILPRPQDWILREHPVTWRGLCRVQFKFPRSVKYPCLPVCHDARLIFPRCGTSDCTLDEARVAQELGAELTFLRVWEYDSGDDSLTRFMEHFIAKKAQADEIGRFTNGEWVKCDAKKCDHSPTCTMRDEVEREIDKLMMNSLIGKLSQNRGDVDVEQMKKFAAKEGLPLAVCMSPRFLHPDKPRVVPRIGGHIMPEWSALILGKARSIMAVMLNKVGVSLICSTDSLLVPNELNALVDEAMKKLGVVLTSKNKGKDTHRIRVIRNRVYGAETESGEIIFGASHAIHLGSEHRDCDACQNSTCKHPLHNAIRFILSEETEYDKTKRLGLKTAIRKGAKFFAESLARMTFKRAWDMKRRLLPDGLTIPWEDLDEYEAIKASGVHVTLAE